MNKLQQFDPLDGSIVERWNRAISDSPTDEFETIREDDDEASLDAIYDGKHEHDIPGFQGSGDEYLTGLDLTEDGAEVRSRRDVDDIEDPDGDAPDPDLPSQGFSATYLGPSAYEEDDEYDEDEW